MKRRTSIKRMAAVAAFAIVGKSKAYSKTFLTESQARKSLWGGASMKPVSVKLSSAQTKSIKKVSGVRVRNKSPKVWKTSNGGWFIVDQVIGKHENIDMAYALTSSGKVKGMEVLVYRETYGHEIMNKRWQAQFNNKGPGQKLKLDRDIKNISGATLSCKHVTEGINRVTETWNQVLKHL